jgi:hypothetical protein
MAFQLAIESGILFVKVNTNSVKISNLLTAVSHIKHFIPTTGLLSEVAL